MYEESVNIDPSYIKKIYRSIRLKEILSVILILTITVLFFTWPLVLHLDEDIPTGSEQSTVALHQFFGAEWTGRFLDGSVSYWDSPYFYPYKGTFAWRELQPFSMLLIWLISKFCGYILAYNVVTLTFIILFGLAGYMLCRLLIRDRAASLWCAVWLSGGAYSIHQLCCLPFIAAGFPSGCILFIFLFAKEKKFVFLRVALLLYILTWLTCEQFGLFLTILLPVILIPFLSFKKFCGFDNTSSCTNHVVYYNQISVFYLIDF